MVRRLTTLTVLIAFVASCSPEEAELTTTTTTSPSEVTTSTVGTGTTGDTGAGTSTAGEDGEGSGVTDGTDGTVTGLPEYETVVRSSTNDGEVLWILVEPADYTGVDLENLIRVLVDTSEVTLAGVNVFDDLEALEAGRVDVSARTPEEQALVDEHFLVSLVDGAVIRFEGPYSDLGEVAVGS